MKFDWYQASVPGVDPSLVMSALAASEYYGEWQETRPLKGYDIGAQFVVGSEVFYRVNHGGVNEQYGANVLGTGCAAQKLADVVRGSFPEHRVSRVDSCQDYHHKDVYDYLREKALKVAEKGKVQVREIVKPLADSDDGRTLYLGSQKSAISMRIYEKGKQLGCNEDWVRAEIQVRPQKDAKSIVALLSPVQVWALTKWSHQVAIELGHESLKRVDLQVYQKSDHDRAYGYMLRQYRRVLEQMRATHGSPETVGAQIFYDLGEMMREQSKGPQKPV